MGGDVVKVTFVQGPLVGVIAVDVFIGVVLCTGEGFFGIYKSHQLQKQAETKLQEKAT